MALSSNGRSLFSHRGEVAASGRITPILPPLAVDLLVDPELDLSPSESLPQPARTSGSTRSPATAIFCIRISTCPSDGGRRRRCWAAENVVGDNVLTGRGPGKTQIRNGGETSRSSRKAARFATVGAPARAFVGGPGADLQGSG